MKVAFPKRRARLALAIGAAITLGASCTNGEPNSPEIGRGAALEAAPTAATPVEVAATRVVRRIEFAAMGTDVVIEAQGDDAAVLDEAIAAARVEFDRVEDMMTSWRDSPLVRMNDTADGTPRPAPKEMVVLIDRALKIARSSGGAFDPTFASVGKLWDFKSDPPVLPTDAALAEHLPRVGWSKVTVSVADDTVQMPAGTRIGLGGIAKGYGVDRAMQVLMDHGVEDGIVNAGGDLKALGTDEGKSWEIAVKHPRDRERAIAVVPVSNVCLVTSGDYERFFTLDGKRYHHILDPRTGKPATGCMSVTITAPNAALADAIATAVCVLGPDQGLELIERLPKVQAIIVGMDGEVVTSSGL